jgi:hypothetical protein
MPAMTFNRKIMTSWGLLKPVAIKNLVLVTSHAKKMR